MPVSLPVPRAKTCKSRNNGQAHKDPEVGLMLRVQRDDPVAFAELARSYWPRVFSYLYRRLSDRQEAEDLAQDVFLRLFRYRKRYQPRAKFNTWLFHITQNVARNALRSRRRRPLMRFPFFASPAEEGRFDAHQVLARTDAPSRRMERAELAAVVRAAVATLGSRQRVALELHQFQHCSYAEIAEEMDMSPKAAKSLLYRARNQLRVSLSGFVLDEEAVAVER